MCNTLQLTEYRSDRKSPIKHVSQNSRTTNWSSHVNLSNQLHNVNQKQLDIRIYAKSDLTVGPTKPGMSDHTIGPTKTGMSDHTIGPTNSKTLCPTGRTVQRSNFIKIMFLSKLYILYKICIFFAFRYLGLHSLSSYFQKNSC